ncbi:glycosyltransferase family 4 protein [Paenibacillus lautus]|uniref:glycosyltransferase family 4 protein n=1 Tax=Paenibacillus lautus TaxID=1401 RepID=UPI000FDB8FAB|nr:glycosyltransferase family 4 protein [Paenibacillus lautus]
MGRHLLIYDVEWWILGKHAKVIQQHHPDLDLMSIGELDRFLEQHSSDEINQAYDRICSLCLGIAAYCIFKHIRIDASAAVSYYYFSQNYETLREWQEDELVPDPEFLRLVIPRIGVIGAMNERLNQALRKVAPEANVEYIGHFVDHRLFQPSTLLRRSRSPLVVGWAGDPAKRSKNYTTLYKQIRDHFRHDERITFMETAGAYSYEDMPNFYHQLDLLLITSANEGSGATALEAYACGVPVLGTHVGNVKAAAHPEAHGLILDSDIPEDFITLIHSWIGQKRKLNDIGAQCRHYIESFWTVEQGIGRWLSVLFQLDR